MLIFKIHDPGHKVVSNPLETTPEKIMKPNSYSIKYWGMRLEKISIKKVWKTKQIIIKRTMIKFDKSKIK
jgi:hypothetical protein